MKNQIIITSSGILIAIIASLSAHFLSIRKENKNSEVAYYKTFEIINANFDWHISQLSRLEISLLQIKETSLITKSIIIEEFPINLNSSIILSSINQLMKYKYSDEKLIKLLIFYSNHLEELNYQLKFASANETISKLDENDIESGINEFFDSIQLEYIDKLKDEIEISRKIMKNAR